MLIREQVYLKSDAKKIYFIDSTTGGAKDADLISKSDLSAGDFEKIRALAEKHIYSKITNLGLRRHLATSYQGLLDYLPAHYLSEHKVGGAQIISSPTSEVTWELKRENWAYSEP